MITVLTGDNAYLINEKVDQLISQFTSKHDKLGVERINLEDVDFAEFKQSLLGYSLFSSSRLVILDRPSVNKEFTESMAEIIESVPETTDLIILEPDIDK